MLLQPIGGHYNSVGNYDRKLYRESWGRSSSCEVSIHGNVEVDKGDLLFLDKVDGLRTHGISTADWYAYPFSKLSGSTLTLASNRKLAAENFIGVAAWHSEIDVTENITVLYNGLFKYPLKNSRTLKVTNHVIPAGSGVTLYSQRLATSSSGSSDHVGLVAKGGKFQASVEMTLLTRIFFGSTKLIA